MTKHNTAEYFDGIPVVEYGGRMRGAFDIPAELGEKIKQDDVYTFLVVVDSCESKIKPNKDGSLRRENTFQVSGVTYVDPVITSAVLELIYEGVEAQEEEDDTDGE